MSIDDAETCARALHRQHRAYLTAMGYDVAVSYDECPTRTRVALRALVLRAEAFASV